MAEIKFAPKEVFDQTLEWFVVPTFDLILENKNGIVIAKRKIVPYKNQWALPGLRIYKGENIDDALERIAKNEMGININTKQAKLVGQFVGKFKTEHNRQDLSTCYAIKISDNQELKPNGEHFSDIKIIKALPANIGAMYEYYIELYLNSAK